MRRPFARFRTPTPVRASTIVNPVVQQMITNTHAVKLQADQNTKAASAAAGAAEDADEKATEALEAARNAAQVAAQAGTDASNALIAADAALEAITKLAHTIDAVPTQNGSLTYTGSAQSPTWNSYNPETPNPGWTDLRHRCRKLYRHLHADGRLHLGRWHQHHQRGHLDDRPGYHRQGPLAEWEPNLYWLGAKPQLGRLQQHSTDHRWNDFCHQCRQPYGDLYPHQ